MTDYRQLVAAYGSPLYVYRLDTVRAALTDLRRSLPAGAAVYYSLKANPHPVLARELRQGDCRAEVSSTGELAAALDAGFDPAEMLYTGPAKGPAELATAVRAGVGRFSAESAADLARIGQAAAAERRSVDCLLRVNARPAGGSGLRMGGGAQFGIDAAELLGAAHRFTSTPHTRVVGAHFFPLSNAADEDALAAEITASVALAARLRAEAGLPMSVLDLGGGFAAPYAQPGARPAYPRLRPAIEQALDAAFPHWRSRRPEVSFESGRYLVGESGALVCTVREVKPGPTRQFVLLDTGIHQLGGMAGLGRLLRPAATPLPPGDAPAGPDGERVTLAGPLCTPADVLGTGIPFNPARHPGPVVFPNVGAYGLTASLVAFLSRPAPAEVVLDGDEVVAASQLSVIRTDVHAAAAARPAE